ncbi:nucleotide exchange factor SIL1 isoform X2 [Cimex lectularius]|uniref:Nucleotide exchange factor SIL1 n=1 Tax=Cimex lectularius TaxID=79782 RepID=A0A8I6TMM1_CIMLE|nr:nucleotide exchange factor SIL1 isoform X2 [Cimex lectularius]
MRNVKTILLFTAFCSTVSILRCEKSDKDNESESEFFVATNEWKPIKKDQAIPRGLHVRMNLNTGEREAKLIDPNEQVDKNKGLSHVSQPDNINLSWEDLKDVLYKMEEKNIPPLPDNQEDIDRVKKKFRSYFELKKELGDVNMDMKTEIEVIGQLIEEYKDLTGRRHEGHVDKKELEHEEGLLSHLEYLLHQTDNANYFMKSNGIKEVVFTSLNSTSWRVRYEAAKLFGSAVQSNPKVQIGALENGAIPVLLRTLVLDSHPKVKSGALYGLSCLIRWFPLAQGQFLDNGGLKALVKQFDSDTSDQLKIQVKALNLINDLIVEIQHSESQKEDMSQKSSFEQAQAKELERQQKSLRLKERLIEEGWCEALINVLLRHPDDFELVELVATSMINIAKPCAPTFYQHGPFLVSMAEKLKNLIGQEDQDYMWIHALFIKLSQLMTRKNDELLSNH